VDINNAFPSNYLKSEEIKAAGGPVKVQIATVVMEDLDGESKPVMKFHGKDKGMVLNRTNANMCTHIFGSPNTDAWANQWIALTVEPVNFQGRIVDGLRIKQVEQPAPAAPQMAPAPQAAAQAPSDDFPDDIPF